MTSFSTIAVQPEHFPLWDDFVRSCPGGTLFHTSLWKQVLEKSYGGGRYDLAAVIVDDQIMAGFCALTRRRFGLKTAVTPLLTPYTGYLLGENAPNEALDHLSSVTRSIGYQQLQCAPHQPHARQLAKYGYDLTPRQTLTVDFTQPLEQLWQQFAPHVRRNIRKAERAPFQISERWDPTQGYYLFTQTFSRRNQPCPVGERFFHEITSGDLLAPHRRYFCAWEHDQMRACIVALSFNGTVYYQIAAADPQALSAGVPSLLLWHLFQTCHACGDHTFDFIGANTPSITRFKSGFAAQPLEYLQAERSSLIFKGLLACRRAMRRA